MSRGGEGEGRGREGLIKCAFFFTIGGLGFSLQEIGTSLTIVAVLVLPIVSFCFPWVSYITN